MQPSSSPAVCNCLISESTKKGKTNRKPTSVIDLGYWLATAKITYCKNHLQVTFEHQELEILQSPFPQYFQPIQIYQTVETCNELTKNNGSASRKKKKKKRSEIRTNVNARHWKVSLRPTMSLRTVLMANLKKSWFSLSKHDVTIYPTYKIPKKSVELLSLCFKKIT